MPPQHAQTGGDVLDQALHAARTTTANQQGFFHAVAGTRSPLNNQSSRIPKPFATNPFLGGGTTPTVATPEQQATLALPQAKKGQRQAKTIEQNYVKAADTQKVVQKTTDVGRGHTGVQGAATTAPNIAAVGQRALGLIGSGIPLGSSAPAAIAALSKLGLTGPVRQQVIGGFAHDTTTDTPEVRAAEVAQALAKGNSIPANPTKRQLLTAALSPHEHKPSLGDIINPFNIAKDALYTPVYAAEGGFALGHATRAALPKGIGGQGDTSELAAIGKSQIDTLRHPILFAEQHPFQAALTALGAAKGVGAVAGKAAGLEAAPRIVPASQFGDVPIPRGELSANLTTRAGQNVADFALGKSKRLQGKALQGETRKIANTVRIEQNQGLKAAMQPLADASKGISRRRQASLLYNEAQGATAPEFEQFYRDLAKENESKSTTTTVRNPLADTQALESRRAILRSKIAKDRFTKGSPNASDVSALSQVEEALAKAHEAPAEITHTEQSTGNPHLARIQSAQANLRGAQAKRFGPVNEKEQAFVDAARHAAQTRTEMLTSMKTPAGTAALDPLSAKWRDYQHLVGLRASQGDPLAQAVTEARGQAVSSQIGTDEHAAANAALAKSLDAFAASTDAQPFRVPTTKPKIKSEFNYPGRSLRAKTDVKSMVSGLKNSTGAALESGNYPHDPANFYRELQQPHTAAAAIEYTNRVSKELGKPAIPGEAIPEGMVLRNVTNLRTTPKAKITATDSLNTEADALKSLQDEFLDPTEADITHVPATGNFLLIPKPVYDQIASNVARVAPKGLEAGLSKVTRAYKSGVLFTRPAYPASNFTNSMVQAALGGAGPTSFLRRNALPLPAGVEDAGFIASEFRKSGRLGFRSGLDAAKVTPGVLGKTEAIARGAGRALDEQYMGRIKRYSVTADNVWRKALYGKNALKEARKGAYPEDGAVKRLLVRRRASDAAIQDYARQMAEGETPATKAAADRALRKTNDFLNDFGAMKHYKTLDLVVPFNSWTRFSATLLLKTLPLNYPGRTLLLYRLGQLGQQGTSQQGVLPQYLQESIPLAGVPGREWLTNTQRANSFATLGTTFPPSEGSGNPDFSQIVGNLSPFLPLITNTLTGKDLQTGRPLTNAQGEPITANPLDQARYAASQVAAFLPPLGVATGGSRGKADTSIPLPFVPGAVQPRKPSSAGPLLQQPSQPWWLPIVNTIAPIRIDVRNLHADQYNGANRLQHYLAAQQAAEIKKEANQPGGVERATAKWTAISQKINANLLHYLNDPKAVDALLASGVPGKSG